MLMHPEECGSTRCPELLTSTVRQSSRTRQLEEPGSITGGQHSRGQLSKACSDTEETLEIHAPFIPGKASTNPTPAHLRYTRLVGPRSFCY